MDYHAKMGEAFEIMDFQDGDSEDVAFEKTLKAADKFKEISDYCKQVPLYKKNEERRIDFQKFIEENTSDLKSRIQQTLLQILNKVTEAPTSIHVTGVVVLLVPMLSDYIEQYQKQTA